MISEQQQNESKLILQKLHFPAGQPFQNASLAFSGVHFPPSRVGDHSQSEAISYSDARTQHYTKAHGSKSPVGRFADEPLLRSHSASSGQHTKEDTATEFAQQRAPSEGPDHRIHLPKAKYHRLAANFPQFCE